MSAKDDPSWAAPKCEQCGAEITTGLMAVFCPRREKCDFYPEDAESQDFLESLRGGFARGDA